MNAWWPPLVLVGFVALLLIVSQREASRTIFRWLPIPLWCYGIPMILRTVGWLPASHASYAWMTDQLLPIALALLLLGVDWFTLARVGSPALMAMLIGATGIVLGGPVMLAMFQSHLPAEAWKGIGTLAATWTGGSLNMLALRTILQTPDVIFAPLVVVDALVAYSWMACLISGKGIAPLLNRWLRTSDHELARGTISHINGEIPWNWQRTVSVTALAVGLALLSRMIAQPFPLGRLVATRTGWMVLLVTSTALILSCLPTLRRLGQHGSLIGYPCLYLVLASLGAQASLSALAAAPAWVLVGFGWVGFHAALLLVAGRMLRIPLGVVATASQANVGGVVSAPLVGAVYHQTLAPVGLLLAIGGNAIGTYLGLLSASLCRWLVGS